MRDAAFLMARRSCRAVTLIEIMVAVAIMLVLAAAGMAGLSSAEDYGRRVRELNSAKTLALAYLQYANDHDGNLLPGYAGYDAGATISLPNGTELAGEEAKRYPWRLGEYIDWNIEGIYFINRTKKFLAGLDPDSEMYYYEASLAPALGMNAYCVGGYYSAGSFYADGTPRPLFDSEVATRISKIEKPGRLIAFVSTHFQLGTQMYEGYFYAVPPIRGTAAGGSTTWSSAAYSAKSSPVGYGYVDFRYGDKAMCAFMDGHSSLMSITELRDMQFWAPKADSASYVLKSN